MAADLERLGSVLKSLRRDRDLRQRELIERIKNIYTSTKSIQRIENGEMLPERRTLITILRKGLEITDVRLIDEILGIAEYTALTASERQKNDLSSPEPD